MLNIYSSAHLYMEELLTTNAIYSDLKLKQMAEGICDLRYKTNGDRLEYYNGDELVMSAIYYPLFETTDDGGFTPFVDGLPKPDNEKDINALITVLYKDHQFIDCIRVPGRSIWVGLDNLEYTPNSPIGVV